MNSNTASIVIPITVAIPVDYLNNSQQLTNNINFKNIITNKICYVFFDTVLGSSISLALGIADAIILSQTTESKSITECQHTNISISVWICVLLNCICMFVNLLFTFVDNLRLQNGGDEKKKSLMRSCTESSFGMVVVIITFIVVYNMDKVCMSAIKSQFHDLYIVLMIHNYLNIALIALIGLWICIGGCYIMLSL